MTGPPPLSNLPDWLTEELSPAWPTGAEALRNLPMSPISATIWAPGRVRDPGYGGDERLDAPGQLAHRAPHLRALAVEEARLADERLDPHRRGVLAEPDADRVP